MTKKKTLAKKNPPKIKIYTTPTCPYCKQAKAYFKSKGLSYEEVDVSSNQKAAQQMIAKTGHMAVPQIEINGKIIIGFDKEAVDKLLKK